MIVYTPLLETMKKKKITKYKLVHHHKISQSTITRINKGQYISLDVIDRLCDILDCKIQDILLHEPN